MVVMTIFTPQAVGFNAFQVECCAVQVAQSCPTLCDPMDYTVRGILQARILEWGAFPFSRGSSQPWDPTQVCALQADSLPTELSGKPYDPAVSLLGMYPEKTLIWKGTCTQIFITALFTIHLISHSCHRKPAWGPWLLLISVIHHHPKQRLIIIV